MPSLFHSTHKFLWLFLCMSTYTLYGQRSVFIPMPQGYYSMHYLRPRDDYHRRCQQPSLFAATGAYHQSFNDDNIARALFHTTQLTFAGSQVPNRQPNWLRADDIGLAPDFLGTIAFHPRIRNLSLDLFYHVNLASWCEALWIELGTTLVNAQWNLCAREKIQNAGSFVFPVCAMSENATDQTARTIQQALSGCFLFGDMQVPWRAGKFVFDTQSITRLADISAALGLDVYHSDQWTLSVALLTLMPTGNKFHAGTLFSPLVGNGDHWELGITLQAIGTHCFEEQHQATLFASATMTHPFKNIQQRTFDFNSGPFSRYTLLKKLRKSDDTFVYDNILMNAVNFTTRAAMVRVPIHGDVILSGAYQYHHFVAELGYHFYGRAAENVRLVCTDVPCEVQGAFYLAKGAQGVCETSLAPGILTAADLNTRSGAALSTIVNTVYVQTGFQWEASCMTPTLLIGVEGSSGSYGIHRALCQWGFWMQLNTRF